MAAAAATVAADDARIASLRGEFLEAARYHDDIAWRRTGAIVAVLAITLAGQAVVATESPIGLPHVCISFGLFSVFVSASWVNLFAMKRDTLMRNMYKRAARTVHLNSFRDFTNGNGHQANVKINAIAASAYKTWLPGDAGDNDNILREGVDGAQESETLMHTLYNNGNHVEAPSCCDCFDCRKKGQVTSRRAWDCWTCFLLILSATLAMVTFIMYLDTANSDACGKAFQHAEDACNNEEDKSDCTAAIFNNILSNCGLNTSAIACSGP